MKLNDQHYIQHILLKYMYINVCKPVLTDNYQTTKPSMHKARKPREDNKACMYVDKHALWTHCRPINDVGYQCLDVPAVCRPCQHPLQFY